MRKLFKHAISASKLGSRKLVGFIIVLATTMTIPVSYQESKMLVSSSRQNDQAISGSPIQATSSVGINFTDLAKRESLAPTTPQIPEVIPEPGDIPGNLPMPSGLTAPVPALTKEPGAGEAAQFSPSPAPTASFQALGDNNRSIPPDVHGAVGPNHLMTTLNTEYRIQDRVGTVISTVSSREFWARLNSPDTPSPFDPRILYEPYGQRWIITAVSNARSASSSILIGVSQTSDPTGNWNLHRIDTDANNMLWADYPCVGFNRNWVVVQVNMFTSDSGTFSRTQIYAFNKSRLYEGDTATATTFSRSDIGGTQVPAVIYDPSLTDMYLVGLWDNERGALRIFTITGEVGKEVLSLGPFVIGEAWSNNPLDRLDFAPQLNSPQRIQNNDSRIQNVVYRNGSLWTTQTIFLPAAVIPTRSAVQWWQFDTKGAVQQLGRIDDPTGVNFYAFPSIAVNRYNDMLIGYSRFSSREFASANYSFRGRSDPANTLRDDKVLKAGEAPYFKIFSGNRNRWGDYSHTVVDPINDANLWTIQEYAARPAEGFDRWGTWWGQIQILTGGICASQYSLKPTPETISTFGMLYRLRDEVFPESEFGRQLINIHHSHSGEAAQILASNPRLQLQLLDLLISSRPAVNSLLNGDGRVPFNRSLIRKLEAYVNAMALRSSPEMRAELVRILEQTNLHAYEGRAVADVWHEIGHPQ